MYLLMDYIKEAIDEMSTIKPEDIGARTEIMKLYNQNPEAVLNALEIKLVNSKPTEENEVQECDATMPNSNS